MSAANNNRTPAQTAAILQALRNNPNLDAELAAAIRHSMGMGAPEDAGNDVAAAAPVVKTATAPLNRAPSQDDASASTGKQPTGADALTAELSTHSQYRQFMLEFQALLSEACGPDMIKALIEVICSYVTPLIPLSVGIEWLQAASSQLGESYIRYDDRVQFSRTESTYKLSVHTAVSVGVSSDTERWLDRLIEPFVMPSAAAAQRPGF